MIQSLPNEQWKPIKGLEKFYEISNLGRVKSLERFKKSKNQYAKEPSFILIKESILKHIYRAGYPCICLHSDGVRYNYTIHRLLALHFIENPDNKPQINHIDGNKMNYDLNNLEWVTSSENIRHAIETGLTKFLYGKDHQNSKMVVNMETGVFYDSIKEAAGSLNIHAQNLTRYLNGHIKINPTSFAYAI